MVDGAAVIASRIWIAVANRLSHRPYLPTGPHLQHDWIKRTRRWAKKHKTGPRVISPAMTRTDQAASL